MNPRHKVFRLRPWETPAPLRKGAGEWESYGLSLRARAGRWRLSLAMPTDATIVTRDVEEEEITGALLEILQMLAPRKNTPRKSAKLPGPVVWVHDLRGNLADLLRDYRDAFAYADDPKIRSTSNGVTIEYTAYEDGEKVTLTTVERELKVAGLTHGDVTLSTLRGSLASCDVTFPGLRTVRLRDTYPYYPYDLGDQRVRGTLLAQAQTSDPWLARLRVLHPALIARQLGRRCVNLWSLHDVAPSLTPAAVGARVFKRHYLPSALPRVPYGVESAAELAFHGGKVGLWRAPGNEPYVEVYDARGAYGWAMTLIPPFLRGRWVLAEGREWDVGAHVHGFVRIDGTIRDCRWPVIPDHVGHWLPPGRVRSTWVTSYEVSEAINAGELALDRFSAWLWIEDDHGIPSPWKRFAEDAFRQRDIAPDIYRAIWKHCLTGLYGKTVQRAPIPPVPPEGAHFRYGVPIWRCDERGQRVEVPTFWRAGSFYYPAVGSLITGLVRARIHQAEHYGQAVHTAVDAVHCTVPLPDDWLGPGLGAWRLIAKGRGRYRRANDWRVLLPDGRMKAAASGIAGGGAKIEDDAENGTTDLEGALIA